MTIGAWVRDELDRIVGLFCRQRAEGSLPGADTQSTRRHQRGAGVWRWVVYPPRPLEAGSCTLTALSNNNDIPGSVRSKSVSISVSRNWQKRIRAHGECLGVKCRRRTWYTAKSSDEVCTTARVGGVRMGKPGRGHTLSPAREGTRGSETSKYPEEKRGFCE